MKSAPAGAAAMAANLLSWATMSLALSQNVLKESEDLRGFRARAAAAGLPADHHVGPEGGKMLEMLVRLSQASRAVEIGTLAGYSSWWIARGLKRGGTLDTVEHDAGRAAVARFNLRETGLSGSVRVHAVEATRALPALARKKPFDFAFFDADKPIYPRYARWCLDCLRPGGVAVFDDANRYLLSPDLGRTPSERRLFIADAIRRDFFGILANRRNFSFFTVIPIHTGMVVALRAG